MIHPGGAKRSVKIVRFDLRDPELVYDDPRKLRYHDTGYLTTLSHLRLAWSDDGRGFTVEKRPSLEGDSCFETFGIEDARVTRIGRTFYITHTAVSEKGVAVGMITTRDFREFTRRGLIMPPHNKDCALFPEKIEGLYYAFHRPGGILLGGNYIWLSSSEDLVHWGRPRCVLMTRGDGWDSARVGINGPPFRTEDGWVALYHGADRKGVYRIGAVLLDGKRPWLVRARTDEPLMVPRESYERRGFYGNVVFSCGHVIRGRRLIIYYGAGDRVVCGAECSVKRVCESLERNRI